MGLAKERLYKLIEELPESESPVVERFLEFLINRAKDPVLRAFLQALDDDEPLTEEESKAIEEGRAEFAKGEYDDLDDVAKELIS